MGWEGGEAFGLAAWTDDGSRGSSGSSGREGEE